MSEVVAKKSLNVVHMNKVEIDIGDGAEQFVSFGAGFDNMSESLNEVVQQYFFLNGEGFANNYVTGMAPSFEMTGVRIVGDTAQDYIFAPSRKYGLLAQRESKIKITHATGDGQQVVITCPITLCNMTDMTGATTDGSAVSVEMRFNGKPELN